VSGEICLHGRPVTGPVRDRIARGLFLVPEDRQREGLVSALSVKANVSLASLDTLSVFGHLSVEREARAVEVLAGDVGIKTASIDAPITSLSGGNQQKVVVAKALMTSPKLLLMDDPMRGIDVGAKAELFRIMTRLAGEGLAILFTSSDLLEVLGMADRILVMALGRVSAELTAEDATPQALVAACTPHVRPVVACS
jgi:erythritol transport system ATP-binding protein